MAHSNLSELKAATVKFSLLKNRSNQKTTKTCNLTCMCSCTLEAFSEYTSNFIFHQLFFHSHQLYELVYSFNGVCGLTQFVVELMSFCSFFFANIFNPCHGIVLNLSGCFSFIFLNDQLNQEKERNRQEERETV